MPQQKQKPRNTMCGKNNQFRSFWLMSLGRTHYFGSLAHKRKQWNRSFLPFLCAIALNFYNVFTSFLFLRSGLHAIFKKHVRRWRLFGFLFVSLCILDTVVGKLGCIPFFCHSLLDLPKNYC